MGASSRTSAGASIWRWRVTSSRGTATKVRDFWISLWLLVSRGFTIPLLRQRRWASSGLLDAVGRLRKQRWSSAKKKSMLVAFFDARGIIYRHYVPPKTNINNLVYQDIPQAFLNHLHCKHPEKFRSGWLLHQDNARSPTAKVTINFITSKNIKLPQHAPYSPGLAPAGVWLLPNPKKLLASQHYSVQQ